MDLIALADRLEELAGDSDPDTAEWLLGLADEYRAQAGSVDEAAWRAAS